VKRVLVVALLLTSCAATAVDEGMVMSASERQFLFQKMLNMQQKIDELEKALRTEKVRTGCA
jgi:cytochrome c556